MDNLKELHLFTLEGYELVKVAKETEAQYIVKQNGRGITRVFKSAIDIVNRPYNNMCFSYLFSSDYEKGKEIYNSAIRQEIANLETSKNILAASILD